MTDKYKAEPYQMEGIRFICDRPHCGLFADPGAGKTGMTLAAFIALKKAGLASRMMVVAPRLVVHNVWPKEIQKFEQFSHLKVQLFHGEGKDIHLFHEFIDPQADVVLVNPEGLKWLFKCLKAEWFTRKRNPLWWPWDVLVVDESTKFKSHQAGRFKDLKKFLGMFTRRIILTGTPTPNSLMDLWSQVYILDQGATLGTGIGRFRESYFKIDNPKFFTWKVQDWAVPVIYEKIAPLVLRFDSATFSHLPDLVFNDVTVTMNPKAQKVYDDMERSLFTELDGNQVTALNGSSKYLLCRQMASGRFYDPDTTQPDTDVDDRGRKVHTLHREKLEALDGILDELWGKPALVSYFFRHDLTALKAHLEKKFKLDRVPFIGAGASVADINRNIELWNKGQLPVLVVHPQSMAHGLNLQAGGNDLVFYSLTDNLEDYQQLIKRIHRRGVQGQVRVHRIITEGTLDVAVVNRLNHKAQDQKALLDFLNEYKKTKTQPTSYEQNPSQGVFFFGGLKHGKKV